MQQRFTCSHAAWLLSSIRMIILSGMVFFHFSLSAGILISGSDISITLTTGPEFLIDANKGCNGEPRAAYVGYEICNLTSGTLRQLELSLGNFTQPNTGLAGGQRAVQWIGDMAPGECRNFYWYVYYNCANANAFMEMTLTVSDASASSVSQTFTVNNRSVITASAGGMIVSMNDSIGGYVGSVLVVDYLYSFGNMKKDGEVCMQPAGNLNFSAACFQLIGTEVTASDVNGIPVGDRGHLYYVLPSNTNGSSHYVGIRYYFLNLCEGQATEARGYAAATSGSALKLSPNIGDPSIDFSLPEAVNPFEIAKSVSTNLIMPGESANYTVTISNASSQYVVIDRVRDVLPPDFVFDTTLTGSDIHVSNSSKFPLRGDADTLIWQGGAASPVYPYTEFLLGPNDALQLRYSSSAVAEAAMGEYINYVQAFSGAYETPYAAAWLCVGHYPCTLDAGEWLFFEAKRDVGGIRLAWSVVQPEPSVLFHAERSADGQLFESIASVQGYGRAGAVHAYDYLDPFPLQNAGKPVYYRIRWQTAGGTAAYSSMQSVLLQVPDRPALYVYPAETPNHFRIRYSRASAGSFRVRITSIIGNTVLDRMEANDSFETGGLPGGVYLLTVSDGVISLSRKFIVTGH